MGCTIPIDPDDAIQNHRQRHARQLPDDSDAQGPHPDRHPSFVNPEAGQSVPAAEFLHHLDLDTGPINTILTEAYPYLHRNRGLMERVHARVKFLAWMTLKGYQRIQPAYEALLADPNALSLLGFERIPAYDTLRECLNDRLTSDLRSDLMDELLAEQARLHPGLGDTQAQDATPIRAARWEDTCPLNGYYEMEMQKLELRWDPEHEALLTQQFYHGTAAEGQWLLPFHDRLEKAGIKEGRLTVDGGYTALTRIAHSWARGIRLRFREKDHWNLDVEAARADVEKRYNASWEQEWHDPEAGREAKARLLVRQGGEPDVEAVGRWVRDRHVADLSAEEKAERERVRSRNEGLHTPLKRLPLEPTWRGLEEMLARVQVCCLTVHLVQLTRLQNGVTEGLARLGNIL